MGAARASRQQPTRGNSIDAREPNFVARDVIHYEMYVLYWRIEFRNCGMAGFVFHMNIIIDIMNIIYFRM